MQLTTSTDPKSTAVSGFLLERTAKRMKQACQQQFKAAGIDLTVDQWVILQALQQQDGISQYEIAQKTFKDAPTVTRIIDLLCKKKLTSRENDPNDRRRFRICLTTTGRKRIQEVLPLIQEFRAQAYQNLKAEQLDQLTLLLNTIFDNLTTDQ